jgi:Flp pilus assembly protein TadD/peroxiredoxin
MFRKDHKRRVSRRKFLSTIGWTPALLLPAPLSAWPGNSLWSARFAKQSSNLSFADARLIPHFPTPSPLDDLLRKVIPGTDEFVTEKYAAVISQLLNQWSRGLTLGSPALQHVTEFSSDAIAATSWQPDEERSLRSDHGITVLRRKFPSETVVSRGKFLDQIKNYFASVLRVTTAEFEIVNIAQIAGATPTLQIEIRYDFVASLKSGGHEERIGHWHTEWVRDASGKWLASRWELAEETLSRTLAPIFIDVTSQALGDTDSYRRQMLYGVDYWRTTLDGACGIDVYGNNGLAVGDFDNDGRDDLYVCQPSGLPNRLYRNRGDGTFEDVTEKSGMGVLDGTACALFADFENRGLQDLLVVCGSGPLLFQNQGDGKFLLKSDAFKFARAPEGTFTHAAIADYDRDGRLDIYFCVYNYYLGLDQYHYPTPYFDARNGPPNFLFHNEGNATFQDRTAAAGLTAENDRYSFACAWGDYHANGLPSLYVANDFGRGNLYRNNGDGTFAAVSDESGATIAGAGMSACWLDFDNDGKQDIYVANMWSAAGLRVSKQPNFQEKDPENVRALYRQHASGNSLYRNLGNGKFANVAKESGVAIGRWAWCSDSCDFDQDGWPDLYIANGYISGPNHQDLGSFFWRQLVAKSPSTAIPSGPYERGWSAINELIRSDSTWSGYERNICYLNNHDGTFSEISGAAGLDFPDDSRSFVLADLDYDGRPELILKNRNAPQLRILHNVMSEIGNSVVFRLRGKQSNRDGIGSAVTVEAGTHRQTKYLQAGSGFLAQHSKELFFGVGTFSEKLRVTIAWPNGIKQTFENLPTGHRIQIEEGNDQFVATPFAAPPAIYAHPGAAAPSDSRPTSVETWLIESLIAPEFSLPDRAGRLHELRALRGTSVLLSFFITTAPHSLEHLRVLNQCQKNIGPTNLRVLAVNVDDLADAGKINSLVSRENFSFPILLATPDVAGCYDIFYRYIFDRRRDLGLPTSFLLDENGAIVKVYQNSLTLEQLSTDLKSLPKTAAARIRKALPFPGTLYQGAFQRNDFTFGVALFQHGYLGPAAAAFKQVIAAKPDDPEAYYNLGTLSLRTGNLPDARQYLEQSVKLRPDYPEAWNNLGMIAAQQGRADDALHNFEQSLQQRPNYVTALLNLANLDRRRNSLEDAQKLLQRALDLEPENPEVNYALGMLYARQEQFDRAQSFLESAARLRPGYAEALNNLGVLFVREHNNSAAEEQFKTCIRLAPNFDQAYLNLAELYVIQDDKESARQVLQSLLRLQPGHAMAQKELEMLK